MHPSCNYCNRVTKLIKNFRVQTGWDVTDTIIRVEDIVYNQYLDFIESTEPYVCIRSYKMSCIYVKQEDFDTFRKLDFYCEKEKVLNLSVLLRYAVAEECFAQVMNKSTPAEVNIKQIKTCSLNKMTIYVTRIIKLNNSDQLFHDLMNYQIMKDKYKLK